MNSELVALLEQAKSVSIGLIQVAATKPNETPLQSNALTFRGTAYIVSELVKEINRRRANEAPILTTLRRVANLEVRAGAELIKADDWRAIAEELQVIAQETIAAGSGGGPKRVARTDRARR